CWGESPVRRGRCGTCGPGSAKERHSRMAAAFRPPPAPRLFVLVVVPSVLQAQILYLARQGVAAPAEQVGGIAAAAAAVLEGDVDHGFLEHRRGLLEDA